MIIGDIGVNKTWLLIDVLQNVIPLMVVKHHDYGQERKAVNGEKELM